MRAVKYGVTRHQVLGLEAVLATGEVIRTGGKFVKATTGYDLTQLIIGSEGTLALVTEATLKLYPRLAPPGHGARAVPHARRRSPAAVPRIVDSGVGPLILEYIDMLTMSAMTAYVGLDLGIPEDIKDTALAYLVVMMENRHEDRLDEDVETAGRAARRARRDRRLRAPAAAAAQLIDAREKAFWVAKANGADDIVDVVVPRASIPEFMAKVGELAAANQSVDRRVRPRRRRQRAPLDLPTRPRGAVPRDSASSSRSGWRSAARSRASTASARPRSATSSSWRTR